MHTEAVFEDIANHIEKELEKANSSIVIAVAWFTNRNLFDTLLQKAKQGCTVQLMITDDEINSNSQIDYALLGSHNSCFYKIGNDVKTLMHNKFCVIDNSVVITGSYNWSYKAETNHENIVIHYDDHQLARQFIAEFNYIKSIYFPEKADTSTSSLNEIIKRLEVLQHFIVLEDFEDIEYATTKLKKNRAEQAVDEIVKLVEQQLYRKAVESIQKFIAQYRQLAVWDNPEMNALKLELKITENQINAFENEKTDLEKTINDFQYRHTKELGELILNILKLQKEKFKADKKRFEEAENDYNDYQKQYETEIKRNVIELQPEEQKELKKQYKSASMLCHPDKFVNEPPEIQQQAERLFKELNDANSRNDLNRVKEILNNLQKGQLTVSENKISDKDLLIQTLNCLKQKLTRLQKEIEHIKESEVYQQICSIADWDSYFQNHKELLQQELEDLQNER